MDKEQIKINNSDEVSKDTVYSELYAEMRRHRDCEITISTWYMVILLGISGAILSVKFGSNYPELSQFLNNSWRIRSLITLFVLLIGFSGWYSAKFASQRYHELRESTDILEPKWKKENFTTPKKKKITPLCLILLTYFSLIAVIIIIIWF